MALATTGLFSFGMLLFISTLSLLCAFIFRRTKASLPLVFSCVVLIAAIRFLVGSSALSERDTVRLVPQLPIENMQCIGRISQSPAFYAYRSGTSGIWVFSVKCEGLKLADIWTQHRGQIEVRISGVEGNTKFRMGERIWLSGKLLKKDYPGGEPIEIVVKRGEDWEILKPSFGFSPLVIGQRLREAASQTLSNGVENHPTQLAVLKALLLGYRKAIPEETYDQFRRTGTLHIFAISGLHVGIVALLLVAVLKAMGVPRDWWGVWLIPLLLFYVCSTGMKSSALRALTMATIYFIAPLFRRKPDVPNAVAFAAILLLWIHPTEILSAGFIFSFTVVSFLVMVFAILPRQIITGGSGWTRPFRAYFASLVITSMAASIASAPLAALFFGSFAPISLVGNLIVVPLTFCIVLCGWLSIVFPFVAEIFNHAAIVFINGLLGTVSTLGNLPGAYWYVTPPSLLAVLFWYVGWISIFTHARSRQERLYTLILVGLAVGLVLI
jgi:ComEC/Rec2-related protein